MKVHVKVFPIAGLCDRTKKLDIALEDGSMNELQACLRERLDVNNHKIETLMFLHNGHALDKQKDAVFKDGDQLWLMPVISGG